MYCSTFLSKHLTDYSTQSTVMQNFQNKKHFLKLLIWSINQTLETLHIYLQLNLIINFCDLKCVLHFEFLECFQKL